MPDEHYRMAIDLSRTIAAEVGTPRVYLEKEREVALSRELFGGEPLIAAGLSLIAGREACIGHGISHVEKVAVDSGALVLIEAGAAAADARTRRLVLLAHLAGLFHDICRTERDHAERGAEEATTLLAGLALGSDECAAIAAAIGNHEAFRPCQRPPDRAGQLLSAVLYDADKFRWGPDNFTETLWAMVALRGIPLPELLPRLLPGIEGVGRVRDTFRTPTGKDYGPDFIDRGVAIGRKLHAVLSARFPSGEAVDRGRTPARDAHS